jgi:hypothetical protein
VSGLGLVTGAAGAGRRIAGLLLDRGVPVRAFAPTQDHRAEHLRQPGAEVAAGDLREIADVEPGAGNNRAVGTATASSFLNSDAPLAGSGRRGGQRPRNGLPVQANCCPVSLRYRSGLLAGSARRARCAGMRAPWPAITGRSAWAPAFARPRACPCGPGLACCRHACWPGVPEGAGIPASHRQRFTTICARAPS